MLDGPNSMARYRSPVGRRRRVRTTFGCPSTAFIETLRQFLDEQLALQFPQRLGESGGRRDVVGGGGNRRM
jgi:hypothetical protein